MNDILNHPIDPQYTTSIKITLSAIYVFEKVKAIASKDSLILARHYHHLAWLYRDLPKQSDLKIDELHGKVPTIVQTECEALQKALDYYEIALYESSIIDQKNITHTIQQLMGRINIQLNRSNEAELLIQESSKTAEHEIKLINEKLDNDDIDIEIENSLTESKSKYSGFLMENIELFQKIESK